MRRCLWRQTNAPGPGSRPDHRGEPKSGSSRDRGPLQAWLERQSSRDGLELGDCYLNPKKTKLTFAGARVPLFVVNDDGVTEIEGTRYRGTPPDQRYEQTEIELKPGITFCMSSDGYLDHVGGKRRRMFGKRRFKELLRSLQNKPVAEQKDVFRRTLPDYQGAENRRDDVSVVAFRV